MSNDKRDHGGDLDRAIATYGDGQWLDLSTGINPRPYPVKTLGNPIWNRLPTRADLKGIETVAAQAYRTNAAVVALAGAQAAIQLAPRLAKPARACVVGPTYNEHAAALKAQGWTVDIVSEPSEGSGAELLTIVNPNNPDGRRWYPEDLYNLKDQVGILIVDESFADTEPQTSVAPLLRDEDKNIVLLRSFGKFFGLAGLRLGFAITGGTLAEKVRTLAGPWAVSGPAIALGKQALGDIEWQSSTRRQLQQDARRLDGMARAAGWKIVGGTDLFRTYETADARAVQSALAEVRIWSRAFPYSETWLRLGLPGSEADWARLKDGIVRL